MYPVEEVVVASVDEPIRKSLKPSTRSNSVAAMFTFNTMRLFQVRLIYASEYLRIHDVAENPKSSGRRKKCSQ